VTGGFEKDFYQRREEEKRETRRRNLEEHVPKSPDRTELTPSKSEEDLTSVVLPADDRLRITFRHSGGSAPLKLPKSTTIGTACKYFSMKVIKDKDPDAWKTLRLELDGEIIDPEMKLEDTDLEDGDQVDVVVTKPDGGSASVIEDEPYQPRDIVEIDDDDDD
jgi:hypothetical protein